MEQLICTRIDQDALADTTEKLRVFSLFQIQRIMAYFHDI